MRFEWGILFLKQPQPLIKVMRTISISVVGVRGSIQQRHRFNLRPKLHARLHVQMLLRAPGNA